MERLTRIQVTKLFGYLNQDVRLNTSSGITILHGANGSGKTTILRAVHELSHKFPFTLSRIPFDEFSLTFDSGLRLVVNKALGEGLLTITQYRGKKKVDSWNVKDEIREYLAKSAHFMSPRTRREYEIMQQRMLFEGAISEDFVEAMERKFYLGTEMKEMEKVIPDWLKAFWKEFHCTLIEEQRLLRVGADRDSSAPRIQRVVTEYSDHLKELISNALREYGEYSQKLDRTFPHRVVKCLSEPSPDATSAQSKFDDINRLRAQLVEVSLVEAEAAMLPLTDESLANGDVCKVLSLYADDMKEKLSLFDDLYRRITLFTDLTQNYFTHKSTIVSRKGMEFRSETGDPLDPRSLSSGEQHILVLFFSLIFLSPQIQHLVLIDEPELSLHPRWQLRFVDDLERIRELSSTDFMLASHSPQIFEAHWDFARDLEI